ncbi:GspH/FimT family pseudopilin [Variovorax paradoxus]|uniref:GspH/FimT family pseudopilin n=1 Tax=Variovorax paradoxus TaxID=34073 RepID=UPI0027829201|nr:GspH/FimT family pseudopilin [Variovorax paradoxus]MDP9933164.1 type IV fimbrial biogenesis protein FimT [Variovorax paradoxus]
MNTSPSSRIAGFTLIELMVTVAVAAVLLVVAVPSFVSFQRNSELTSATNSFVAAVNAARGEAMKRGMNAMVVPTTGTDWSTGWTVFVDQDRSGGLNTGDTTVLQQPAFPSYLSATGQGTASETPAYIMFDASGYAKTKTAGFGALTMTIARSDVSDTAQTAQTRRIVIAKSGRARSCRPSTDTTCTVSAEE